MIKQAIHFIRNLFLLIEKTPIVFKATKILAIIALFASFAYSILDMPLWDYDFWWHIATGRYIVETGSLPEKDIFSYTSILEENKNPFPQWENLILKQYWLSQVIFYVVYDYTGAKGIIILRTTLLIATLLLVFWKLQKNSVSFHISFVFLFILFMALNKSTGERPVLFTIFFTALTFFILDDFKLKKGNKIFLLIPLMLLWANMHGGFIIGIIVIVVFMFGEGLNIILKKGDYTKNEIHIFYAAAITAIAVSFINPAGWDAVHVAMNISAKYKPIHTNIQEYESPFVIYRQKVYPIQYEYIALVLLSIIIVTLRNRKIVLTHAILLLGTLTMSFSALRFIIYYMVIATMILGKETEILFANLIKRRFSEKNYNRILAVFAVAVLFSVILYIAGVQRFERLKFHIASGYSIPEKAVDFIDKNKLSGNMFNDYAYGGYISWKLYPYHKTFIDTRSLNIITRIEYGWIIQATEYAKEVNPSKSSTPLWERLLNHYKINFILIPLLDLYSNVNPIVLKLAESDKWIPVYCDPISIIFMRDAKQNTEVIKQYKLSKEVVYNVIVYQSVSRALNTEVNPRALMSLGEIFYKMGRLEDALKAYKYALKRMPDSPIIQEKIDQIESEIASNKK
jgi:tetratricopeptide (TPR) repeat protein